MQTRGLCGLGGAERGIRASMECDEMRACRTLAPLTPALSPLSGGEGEDYCASNTFSNYFRAAECSKGSQAPLFSLLATHCWMKNIPSTPS